MPAPLHPKQFLRQSAARVLSLLPVRGLDYMDALLQEAQGKGWGYAGVSCEVKAVDSVLKRTGVPSPRTVLDVGANVGDWTAEAMLRWPDAQFVCIEPSPQACEDLRARFHYSRRVDVVQVAAGRTQGTGTLYANRQGSALGSLRPRRLDHFEVSLEPQELVPLRTLDSLMTERRLEEVDVIEIDVEGAEMDVLEGASMALSSSRVVQFEWGEASTGSPVHWVDFWYFWRDQGWDLYRISPRGALVVDRYHPRDEVMTWTNCLAVNRAR